jgi:hypothetical protein
MASWRDYNIIDDSRSFYLLKGKRRYWVDIIEVERPDWDFRVVVHASGKNGSDVITSDPLSEGDFIGKKLSTILKNHQWDYRLVRVKSNPCSEIELPKPKRISAKTTTNENLLLIL